MSLKVCFVAYYFPPITTSGAARSIGFARHMSSFGWEPTVISVRSSKDKWVLGAISDMPTDLTVKTAREVNLNGFVEFLQGATNRIARVFGRQIRSGWYRDLLCVPDAQIAWLALPRIVREARRSDLIYVSCSPFSSAIYATLASKMTGKPLVIDFRDAWSLNPYGVHTRTKRVRKLIRKMEGWMLRSCDHLVLNTPGALALYRETYGDQLEKLTCVPNGFDQIVSRAPSSDKDVGKISIVHVGSFYGSRNPSTLLQALSRIADSDLEFVQVGSPLEDATEIPEDVTVRSTGALPPDQALQEIANADVLYLKQGFEEGISDYIAVAAKTYEYLTTGRPILVDSPAGDNTKIVEEYANAHALVSGRSVEVMQSAIQELVKIARDKSVDVTPNSGFIKAFNRAELTRRIAEVFSYSIARRDRLNSKTTKNVRRRDKVSGFLQSTGLNRLKRFSHSLYRNDIKVLAYHRILDVPATEEYPFDPQLISANCEQFRSQMRHIKQNYDLISVSQLTEFSKGRIKLPKRPLVVTFDDGFDDLYYNAFPILRESGVPASVFVTTRAIDSGDTFWYERLYYSLLKFSGGWLDVPGTDRSFYLSSKDRGAQILGVRQVLNFFKGVPNEQREQVLRHWEDSGVLQVIDSNDERLSRPVSWPMLMEMSANGVEVGSHTVSHPILAQTSDQQLVWELNESKRVIEEKLGSPITSIAYPNGLHNDFDDRVIHGVKEAGYELAFSFVGGVNKSRSLDRYRIKRLPIESIDTLALFSTNLAWPSLLYK